VVIPVLLATFAFATLVWAFAEEPLTFRDPYVGQTTDDAISTVHNDLTYALALAAGFSVTDSITLQVWNQLVDSEQLGPDTVVSYSNCSGAFYTPPDPDLVCEGKVHTQAIWPRWGDMKDANSCVTSRYGPYSPFFHFPHQNARELGALHDWAWGVTDELIGYEAYAWGGPGDFTVMQATCYYTRTVVITTGIEAGSLPAFATYLHSLGDSYSHLDCIAAMDNLGMPWATHTTPPLDPSVPACDYHPRTPRDDDVHGREFGAYTDTQRTDAAILDIYAELVARSLQREGQYFPISLDTSISGTLTLRDMLRTFVHEWGYDTPGPENRRALADQIADAVLAQRRPKRRTYLPLVVE
jgi:hypothetical protein